MEQLLPSDFGAVASLLEENALLSSDIRPDDLRHFLGLRQHGSIVSVGGIQVYGTLGLLRSIAVSSDLRGKGHGTEIVTRLEQYALGNGILRLYLLTETAANFFASLNYETTARSRVPHTLRTTPQFAQLCPDTAVCMTKPLPLDPVLARRR